MPLPGDIALHCLEGWGLHLSHPQYFQALQTRPEPIVHLPLSSTHSHPTTSNRV